MRDRKDYYIIKACKAHKKMLGWSAMYIGENVDDLQEWLETVAREDCEFIFSDEIPAVCTDCVKR